MANFTQGPQSPEEIAERMAVVRQILADNPGITNTDAALILHVSPPTISKYRVMLGAPKAARGGYRHGRRRLPARPPADIDMSATDARRAELAPIRTAAELHGVRYQTVYDWRRRGLVHGEWCDESGWRVSLDDVERIAAGARPGRMSTRMSSRLDRFRDVLAANPGLTNRELAGVMGVDRSTIKRYRRRVGSPVRAGALEAAARALGVLIGGPWESLDPESRGQLLLMAGTAITAYRAAEVPMP